MKTAGEIMTKDITSVTPETPLIEAIDLILKNGFNGLPVVVGGYLVGVLTDYDMIIRGTSIHLPTFLKLFHKIDLYKSDAEPVKEELRKLAALKVADVMNSNPNYVKETSSVFEIIDLFTKNAASPLPVVDEQKILVGVVSRHDIVRFMGEEKINAQMFEKQLQTEEIINVFVDSFDKRFLLVSKTRVKIWLVASVLFTFVGFAIAWILILQVNFK